MPPGLSTLLPALATRGAPLDVLRTAVSLLGAELGWRPTHDIEADELEDQALGLCAVVPTILAAAHRLRQGEEPVEPRADLGFAANYLYMLTGTGAERAHARAIEQYMILTIDHGFNASTFTAPRRHLDRGRPRRGDRGRHRRALGTAARRRAEPGARHARRHRLGRPGRGLRAGGH